MSAPRTTHATGNVIPFPVPAARCTQPQAPAGEFDLLEQLLHQLFGNKYPLPRGPAPTVLVVDMGSVQP